MSRHLSHSATTSLRSTGMMDLGTLGGSASYATDTNDNGQVVGSSDTSGGHSHVAIHNLNPRSMTRSDVDGNGVADLVLDFGNGIGVWELDEPRHLAATALAVDDRLAATQRVADRRGRDGGPALIRLGLAPGRQTLDSAEREPAEPGTVRRRVTLRRCLPGCRPSRCLRPS